MPKKQIWVGSLNITHECPKFYCSPSNSYWENSVWAKVEDQQPAWPTDISIPWAMPLALARNRSPSFVLFCIVTYETKLVTAPSALTAHSFTPQGISWRMSTWEALPFDSSWFDSQLWLDTHRWKTKENQIFAPPKTTGGLYVQHNEFTL